MFHLKEIKLNNFRCFKKEEFSFGGEINVIYGKNAVGKTSLVEAIHILGTCKSHRTNDDANLIRSNQEFYKIDGFINDENEKINEISVVYTKKGKRTSRNNYIFNKMSDFIGYFKVVMFCPEDIVIVKGAPSEKRSFLDLSICLYDKEYMDTCIKYRKILKQKSEYLKKCSELNELDTVLLEVYNQKLAELAKVIMVKRRKFISDLNDVIDKKVAVISGGVENAFIEYVPNCREEDIALKLKENFYFDIHNKNTSVGPHKDTFIVKINDRDASVYASQGQQKTLTLAIKLSLADVIKKYSNNVIIILDDVFGELDDDRQKKLFGLLDKNNQIFITTTNIDCLTADVLSRSKIIDIEERVGENYE